MLIHLCLFTDWRCSQHEGLLTQAKQTSIYEYNIYIRMDTNDNCNWKICIKGGLLTSHSNCYIFPKLACTCAHKYLIHVCLHEHKHVSQRILSRNTDRDAVMFYYSYPKCYLLRGMKKNCNQTFYFVVTLAVLLIIAFFFSMKQNLKFNLAVIPQACNTPHCLFFKHYIFN